MIHFIFQQQRVVVSSSYNYVYVCTYKYSLSREKTAVSSCFFEGSLVWSYMNGSVINSFQPILTPSTTSFRKGIFLRLSWTSWTFSKFFMGSRNFKISAYRFKTSWGAVNLTKFSPVSECVSLLNIKPSCCRLFSNVCLFNFEVSVEANSDLESQTRTKSTGS